MGYDLSPRNKSAGTFHAGAFSWSWALEAGLGLPFGHGRGIKPAQFVYSGRPDGLCLSYNDGARVTAKEARLMATVARWICEYQDNVWNVWNSYSEEQREAMRTDKNGLYHLPVRRDFIDRLRAFADWAETSGGFRVY